MEIPTLKQDAMKETARQLEGCGGGEALEMCLEGVELIRQHASSLDVQNKWLVVEAVAEVMRMRVEETSGRLTDNNCVPVANAAPSSSLDR